MFVQVCVRESVHARVCVRVFVCLYVCVRCSPNQGSPFKKKTRSAALHMNTSYHVQMSHASYQQSCDGGRIHVTYECVMSRMEKSRHVWMRHVVYKCAMSLMDESCQVGMSHFIFEWVMSHLNESRHIWISHVAYECVTSHTDESCQVGMSHMGWLRSVGSIKL